MLPRSQIGLTPDPERADRSFINYYLTESRSNSAHSNQGAAQDNLSQRTSLKKFPVPEFLSTGKSVLPMSFLVMTT